MGPRAQSKKKSTFLCRKKKVNLKYKIELINVVKSLSLPKDLVSSKDPGTIFLINE